jgi:hypothetical protein
MAARIQRSGWPAVWLPLILFWPVIIAVFCLALPLCVIVPAPRRAIFATLVASYHLLCALHGTAIELDAAPHHTWTLSLY